MGIEVRDDERYTSAMPAGSWLIGGQTASDPAPTAFGREAILAYIESALASVASSGSASDLGTGTLPSARLHAWLADISEIQNPQTGNIIYYDGSAFVAGTVAEASLNPQPYSAMLAAIAALTPTDGNVIVGDGTSWVAESGATARSSLGLGTADSPQFTALQIGHATDTTVSRLGAGRVGVEGRELAFETWIDVTSPAYGAVPVDRDEVPVVDSAPAINAALAAGEYRTVFVPNGAYLLGSTLKIGRGTRLVCESPEGVIFYKSHTGTMLSNGLGYTTSSDIEPYEGNGGIVLDGGVWDGFTNNNSGYDGYTHFALGFATGVTVRNATFLNAIGTGHVVDMAACRDVLFEDCNFFGYSLNGGTASQADCIQLDANTANLDGSSPSFPYFGLTKRKLCQNVTVRRCRFGANPDQADVRFGSHYVAVGSHASVWGEWATRVVVTECEFDAIAYAAVRVWKWRDVTVSKCRFTDCERPIHVTATTAGAVSAIDSAGSQQTSSDGSVDGMSVYDCDFIASTDYDLFLADYDYGAGSTAAKHTGIKWTNNRSEGNTGTNGAMAIRYCKDSDFIGNTIDTCVRWFYFSVAATVDNVKINHNRLYNASITTVSAGGIHLAGPTNVEIIGNTFKTCGTRAIYGTQSANHVTVIANKFDAISGAAAYIQSNSADWLIEANKVGTTCLTHDEGAFRGTNTADRITIRGGHFENTAPPVYLTATTGHVDIAYNATPESVIIAPVGSRVMQMGAAIGNVLWLKESGGGTAAGWTAATSGVQRSRYNRATGWTHTGDTSETTKITLNDVIPANDMGPSGELEITLQSSAAANNANVKTVRLKINGTTVISQALASTRSITTRLILTNKDATNAQNAQGTTQASSFASSTVAMASYAFDTTAALDITATIELANSADSVTIEKLKLAVTYGA